MSVNKQKPTPEFEDLSRQIFSPAVPQLIYLAAKLGLADELRGDPRTSEELARVTGTNPSALLRLLRAMVIIGLLREGMDGKFSVTAKGLLLQSDRHESLRDAALINGELLPAWTGLLHSAFTGDAAFDQVFGMGLFQYLSQHDELGQIFNRYMADRTAHVAAMVIAAYDFSPFGRVIDVGGGHGRLLELILSEYPAARGVLLDLPHVLEDSQKRLASAGLIHRCMLVSGDFLTAVPEDGDLYLLQLIIHNWADESARRILENCRRAMNARAKLILIERLLPERIERPQGAVLGDIDMLVLTGGRERTAVEYRQMCSSAGLHVVRMVPMQEPWGLIEAVPESSYGHATV